ncbi:MAG: DinB family protein [Micromonosporaceae bacterium]
MSDPKDTLKRYLQSLREALLWKLDGLSERDLRWPQTPTGTNLLGLVKHVATMELGYFGDVFGRPSPVPMPWIEPGAEDNADLWATADQSREWVVELYHTAWAHSDATIDALSLDDTGEVPWWRPERRVVTLHTILVHVIAETARHAGHADIVREQIDGQTGMLRESTNLPDHDRQWWEEYVATLRRTAEEAGG